MSPVTSDHYSLEFFDCTTRRVQAGREGLAINQKTTYIPGNRAKGFYIVKILVFCPLYCITLVAIFLFLSAAKHVSRQNKNDMAIHVK